MHSAFGPFWSETRPDALKSVLILKTTEKVFHYSLVSHFDAFKSHIKIHKVFFVSILILLLHLPPFLSVCLQELENSWLLCLKRGIFRLFFLNLLNLSFQCSDSTASLVYNSLFQGWSDQPVSQGYSTHSIFKNAKCAYLVLIILSCMSPIDFLFSCFFSYFWKL